MAFDATITAVPARAMNSPRSGLLETVMTTTEQSANRYPAGSHLLDATQFPNMRVEHWRLEAGSFRASTFESNVIALVTSGRALFTRTVNGRIQSGSAQRGSGCIYPLGLHQDNLEIAEPINALYIYLPRLLVARDALEGHRVDPSTVELAYVDSLTDPLLYQLGMAVFGAMNYARQASNQLFVDGLQSALAGHLLSHYAVDRWRPAIIAPELNPSRLKRVLKLIEDRFAEPLTLSELAAQACLSEFHFSRLFRAATGLTPYRYLMRRRVQAAEELLMQWQDSLLGIALRVGFGSQANFIRAFRQFNGITPSLYRAQQREMSVRQI
jgi:AraC family transcriptional regulator